jgi:predicted membrane chloride channel (bestrophin family)
MPILLLLLLQESKLSCFLEGIGVCEQLVGIPIPVSYTRLTSRFLVLWHLTLPVILWDECKWIVVPATFISAASLFCIEEVESLLFCKPFLLSRLFCITPLNAPTFQVGVLIEEPFPMLALDALCKQLHDGIKDVVAVQNSVHARLVGKTGGGRGTDNGWPSSSKREEAKID